MSIRKILVIQLRESPQAREREREAFWLAAGRFERSLKFVDMYAETPDLDRHEGVQGVIIAGSALSVFEPGIPRAQELRGVVEDCMGQAWPLLGICFGAQYIAHALGGEVMRDKQNEELGTYEVELRPEAEFDQLFGDLPERFLAQQAHQDRITCLPDGAVPLAASELCPVQAFRAYGVPVWGIQFHAERTMSDMRQRLLRNLLDRNEDMRKVERARASLRESPEAGRVIQAFIERVAFGLV